MRLPHPSRNFHAKRRSDLGQHSNRGRVRALVDGFALIKPGDRLPIAIDLDRLHLFDRAQRVLQDVSSIAAGRTALRHLWKLAL